MRCAIYFIPEAEHPLTRAATRWLGRDAYTGARVESGGIEGLVEADRAFLTAPVRRHGFHAAIKAPFRLAAGESVETLALALDRFGRRATPLGLGAMQVRLIGTCFALAPQLKSLDLMALAADVVTVFDRFRAPPGELELARRDPLRFNERQYANLVQWGDPHCMDQFRFHMALTGPVPALEREHVLSVLLHHFGPLATAPLALDRLALFFEPEPDAPFCIHSTHALGAQSARRSA